MTLPELCPLIPILIVAAAAVAVLLGLAVHRCHRLTLLLTLAGLAGALLSLRADRGAGRVGVLFAVDGYARFYMGLILAAAFTVALLSYGYLQRRGGRSEEFYVLLLLATVGSAVLVASTHFASFFLGLEVLSVGLYALIAYHRGSPLGVEAGVKYLVLAAASAAFLLFGMAMVYAERGTMQLAELSGVLSPGKPGASAVLLTGLAMLIVGIGFKLAVAPFHLWTPDVYQGAPAPVTAFVATVSKGAVFALLLRFFTRMNVHDHPRLVLAFSLIAIVSMFLGNLLALLQNNVKRILAYSSIAHLGYLLVAFLASGKMAPIAVAYYLAAYFVTTLGAFGIVAVLSGKDADAESLEEYRHLAWRRPWLAGTFTAMLLSLAGIPLTAGFVGKFFVAAAGVESSLWLLVVVLVVNSAVGLFYYLRVVIAMYARGAEEPPRGASPTPLPARVALAGLAVLLIALGVYPAPLLRVIQTLAAP